MKSRASVEPGWFFLLLLSIISLTGCGNPDEANDSGAGQMAADKQETRGTEESAQQKLTPEKTTKLIHADWPMLGRDGTRNPVSPERNAPVDWETHSGKNIRWVAQLASMTHGDPIVVDGMVWVGTNNDDTPDASVLRCFRESDGKPLYKYVSARLPNRIHDWPESSLSCSPLIEGDLMWFTTNRWEVICMDLKPLKSGAGEPNVVWKLDMIEELGVFPHHTSMGLMQFCSPASYRDYIYVVTGNGVDEAHLKVPRPRSPSLICLDKKTGKLIWEDNSPFDKILHGQWSSPLVIEIDGRGQVVTPQGDGWLRSFDALTGKLIWKFEMNYKASKWELGGRGDRNNILAVPVYHDGRVYLANGQDPEHGEGPGRLCCIDPSKQGDVSSEILVDADGQPTGKSDTGHVVANPKSALIWEFGPIRGDKEHLGMLRTVSSVAVHRGLVIAPTISGYVHCLDARTGKRHWTYDALAAIYADPLVVDGKIYIADEDGDIAILGLSANPKQAALNTKGKPSKDEIDDLLIPYDSAIVHNVGTTVYCTPIMANGVLYIAGRDRLIAVSDQEPVAPKREPSRGKQGKRGPRPIFSPTPFDVVDKMIELAQISSDDVVYDLGSGDGRILIAAAKERGCRAVGLEIDPQFVQQSRLEAKRKGVAARVEIREKDLFQADLSQADVVFVYLQSGHLDRLQSNFRQLKPGARIVSHAFAIPGSPPQQTISIQSSHTNQSHLIHLWTAPLPSRSERPTAVVAD